MKINWNQFDTLLIAWATRDDDAARLCVQDQIRVLQRKYEERNIPIRITEAMPEIVCGFRNFSAIIGKGANETSETCELFQVQVMPLVFEYAPVCGEIESDVRLCGVNDAQYWAQLTHVTTGIHTEGHAYQREAAMEQARILMYSRLAAKPRIVMSWEKPKGPPPPSIGKWAKRDFKCPRCGYPGPDKRKPNWRPSPQI